MKQKDIQAAITSATLIAWKSDRGLARVRPVETGLGSGAVMPRTGHPKYDSSRVQIVQSTFDPDEGGSDGPDAIVNNRELAEWTSDTEHTFSLLNDREAFKADTMEAATLAGVAVAKVDPISQLVMLSSGEFQRICQQLAPPTDIIDEGESERYMDDIQNAAERGRTRAQLAWIGNHAMSDSKYGRLFTEKDVQYIVNMMRLEGAPNHVCDALPQMEATGKVQFTFPADEPLFLLRGQDKAAPAAVRCYRDHARTAGAGSSLRIGVASAAEAMRKWQRSHPERVKVPD